MRMTVADVMTTDVKAVHKNAAFHAVAQTLVDNDVSGVPVLDDDGRVVGVVSEADLLHKEEFKERYFGERYRPSLRVRLRHLLAGEPSPSYKATGETAGELMTSPAVVTTPDTPVVVAARMMEQHGVKRLPVVTSDGSLVGIVTRRDLVKVFVRGDEEIERQVRQDIVIGTLWSDPSSVEVKVHDGVVTIAGHMDKHSEAVAVARMAANIDGVVSVDNRITWREDDLAPTPVVWGGA